MIYAGKVAPVNTDLFSNYADIAPFQKMQQWNSVDGVPYGIPHGWGAQLLGFRTDKVTPAPDSWSVVYDPNSPYKGKITMYDSADRRHRGRGGLPDGDPARPEDHEPVRAGPDAVRRGRRPGDGAASRCVGQLLGGLRRRRRRRSRTARPWSARRGRSSSTSPLARQGAGRRRCCPKEGATGWADTWMIDAKSPHPNCAYEWMNYITTAGRPGPGRRVVRRGAGQPQGLRGDGRRGSLRHLPRQRRGLLQDDLLLGDAAERLPRRTYRRQVHPVLGVDEGVEQPEEQLILRMTRQAAPSRRSS